MEKVEKDDIKKVENKRENSNTQISQDTQIFQFVKEKNYMKNNIKTVENNSYKVVNNNEKNHKKIDEKIKKVATKKLKI